MSMITLTIGPKNYTIACADGEEAHITALGAIIAEKYARLVGSRAAQETQNLLFAALFLADELAEARKRSGAQSAPDTDSSAIDAQRTAAAETLANRVEALAELAEAHAAALEALAANA